MKLTKLKENILQLWNYGYEIEKHITTKKDYSLEFCYKCNTYRILDHEDGYYICPDCGEIISPENVIFQIFGQRRKWFEKVARKYGSSQHIHLIVNDFMQVVTRLKRHGLIRTNVYVLKGQYHY